MDENAQIFPFIFIYAGLCQKEAQAILKRAYQSWKTGYQGHQECVAIRNSR